MTAAAACCACALISTTARHDTSSSVGPRAIQDDGTCRRLQHVAPVVGLLQVGHPELPQAARPDSERHVRGQLLRELDPSVVWPQIVREVMAAAPSLLLVVMCGQECNAMPVFGHAICAIIWDLLSMQ